MALNDPILLQLRSLAEVCGKSHWHKIQRNILMTSLGFCFLWTGMGLTLCSQLPAEIECFIDSHHSYVFSYGVYIPNGWHCIHSNLTDDEYSTLRNLFRKTASPGMRRPLQMCLHISPLVVLLDITLDVQLYHENAIIQVSLKTI